MRGRAWRGRVCGWRGACAGAPGRAACAAGGACAGAPGGVPSAAPPRVASPARSGALPPVRRAPAPVTRARAIDALRRLRAVGVTLVKRAWIVCIGYRRFRYELEHPRAPNQVMPLAEAVDIANGCLNPYGFLTEE